MHVAAPVKKNAFSIDYPSSPGRPALVKFNATSAREVQDIVAEKRDAILAALTEQGAVRLARLPLKNARDVGDICATLDASISAYVGGATDRDHIANNVYHATKTPGVLRLPAHTETSYMRKYPTRLFFYCTLPATRGGGQTLLADNRAILKNLPRRIVDKLRAEGVAYKRNMPSFHPSVVYIARKLRTSVIQTWQDSFNTEDPVELERFCKDNEIEMRWREDGSLCLNDTLPALRNHRLTGDEVWFNHINILNINSRYASQYVQSRFIQRAAGLATRFIDRGERSLFGCTYGAGDEFTKEDINAIYAAIDAATISVNVGQNDLVIVDNLLLSHGRLPYHGKREMLYAQSFDGTGELNPAST